MVVQTMDYELLLRRAPCDAGGRIVPVADLLIGSKRPVLPSPFIACHAMADDIVPYAQKGSPGRGMLTTHLSFLLLNP